MDKYTRLLADRDIVNQDFCEDREEAGLGMEAGGIWMMFPLQD